MELMTRPLYAQQIQQRRERQGLTKGQLAAMVLVKPITVSRWEKGTSVTRLVYRQLLAEALGVTAEELDGWFR